MDPTVLQPLIDELASTATATTATAEIFVLDAHVRVVLRGTNPGDLVPVAPVDHALPKALGVAVRSIVADHDFEAAPIAHASADGIAIRVVRLGGPATMFYAAMTLRPAR